MPIYEYECTRCGEIEEAFQKFSDKPKTTCRSCSGPLQRLISQSTFHLKGSGWYVTDYADKGKGAPKDQGASGENKPAPSSASSSESGESSPSKNSKKSSNEATS